MPEIRSPEPLEELQREPKYGQLKNLFRDRLQKFRGNPKCLEDLKAFNRGDDEHDYTELKGLIPPQLIGKGLMDGKGFTKSETFFTNYKGRFPPDFVLSESDRSLIIANFAAHDVRLYTNPCDPAGINNPGRAGMSYMHLLAIPKERIYNIVALKDASIIDEMINHFKTFWKTPSAKEKINSRIKQVLDARIDTIQQDSTNQEIIDAVRKSAVAFAKELEELPDDAEFLFAFHPAPEASVGHLHMHVLPLNHELRKYSTSDHDWKTVLASAVEEVLKEFEEA